ncbi:DUF5777 family beta-barrel protein [Flagellimonas onchidii]|uniref:DUF5777 family beta-barrel protein n=1 Tax=Flagellimonas onchidii TaxID=2562684 RepID=UPI0010A63B82|nr:DUF5777 family beta-barrel protein [Allomuricauda onchidii]
MKNKKRHTAWIFVLFVGLTSMNGQDLLDLLDKELTVKKYNTQATFKANRVLLGQSVETRKKGVMEFTFGTRYWNIPNNMTSQSFGADRFSAHFGVQYSFSNRFTFGLGATTFDGIFNSFAKYRLVRQKEDDSTPLGITLVQGASYFSRDFIGYQLPTDGADRLSHVTQAIFARKFDRNLSLQIAPTYIYMPNDNLPFQDTNFFLVGFGGRYKLGSHVSLVSEYYYRFGREEGPEGFNLFSLGVNWEISDLIFQFSMTNAKGFDDVSNYILAPNNFNFNAGRLHIGVNATYVLHFNQKKRALKSVGQK